MTFPWSSTTNNAHYLCKYDITTKFHHYRHALMLFTSSGPVLAWAVAVGELSPQWHDPNRVLHPLRLFHDVSIHNIHEEHIFRGGLAHWSIIWHLDSRSIWITFLLYFVSMIRSIMMLLCTKSMTTIAIISLHHHYRIHWSYGRQGGRQKAHVGPQQVQPNHVAWGRAYSLVPVLP